MTLKTLKFINLLFALIFCCQAALAAAGLTLKQLDNTLSGLQRQYKKLIQDKAFTEKLKAEREAELEIIPKQKAETIEEAQRAIEAVAENIRQRGNVSESGEERLPAGTVHQRAKELAEKMKSDADVVAGFPRTRPVAGYGYGGRGTRSELERDRARRAAAEKAKGQQ